MNSEQKIYWASAFLLFVGVYFLIAPRSLNIQKYYSILDKDTMELDAKKIQTVDIDLGQLDKCKTPTIGHSSEDCYKSFYEKYARINGPAKSFVHLHAMLDNDAAIIPGCHYIAHGIGAGSLQYFNGDVSKAYAFDVSKYFSNVGACGNGYYHGVSIGMTYGVKTDDDLYKVLYGFCDKRLNPHDLGKDPCNHGLGHAIMLYYDHDLDKSVAMCHRLFTGPTQEGFFGCMTGVRMEYGMFLDLTGLWEEKGAQGIKDLCKDYKPNTEEREACIVEGAGVVRYGENYTQAVKDCQTLDNLPDRKACTKLTIIHSIRLGRSEQAKDLCTIPKTYAERIECTAFLSNYLSLSVDANKTKMFYKTSIDVCHTLNIFGFTKCLAETRNKDDVIFRSGSYRGVLPTWNDAVLVYYFYKKYVNSPEYYEPQKNSEPGYSFIDRM